MQTFDSLGLAEPLLRAVAAEGYTHPTPIQAGAVPPLLAGRDLLGIAQTGTGKTAAFVLPLLDRIARDRVKPQAKGCTALILAPTRELAAQIVDAVRTYGRHARPSVALVVGGAKPGPQIRALAPGVDILVATPGRLMDHMQAGALRLDRTTTVVLDEADQMLDLGFMPAIRRIMAKLPRERQTVLLSATMPKPIRALADDFLSDPAEVSVAPASRPIDRIAQSVMHLNADAKRAALAAVLSDPAVERAIVFTRTKRGADRVARHLEQAGLSAAAIHGDKSQSQRERALAAFRAGKVPILVATDIAARGIDVDDVSHVVNFELPNVPESYVHRIGRTARAGKAGIAVSFCAPGERDQLRDIEKLTGMPLEVAEAPAGIATLPTPSAPQPGARKPNGGQPNGRKPAGKTARQKTPQRATPQQAQDPRQRPPRKRNRRKPQRAEGRTEGRADGERTGLERMLGSA